MHRRHGIAYWIRNAFIVAFVVVIGFFIYSKTRDYRAGPLISVASPSDGATLHDHIVIVEGNVKNATAVFFNDRKIFTNEAGDFKEKLIVPDGYIIMVVRAEDRFHRTAEKRLEIVVTS